LTASISAGARVCILEPAYAAGKIGMVVCLEPVFNDLPSGRWLIRVEAEDILLSLEPEHFLVLD